MSFFFLLGLIGCCEELRSLSELQWKARIVLCKTDSAMRDKLLAATALETEGVGERDIVYFIICDDQLVSNYNGTFSDRLREEIQVILNQESKAVVLIGKDGFVKGAYSSLRWGEIFAVIDAMPMRQREKRK
ncbi:MAG: DUF4174 domain-containing protein [Chloroherpetonaceae bacterium]